MPRLNAFLRSVSTLMLQFIDAGESMAGPPRVALLLVCCGL
jgi:hypothetical protein